MGLELLVQDTRWEAFDLADICARAGTASLAHHALNPDACEIAIRALNDADIARLNAKHRAKDGPTNVLSWPAQNLAPDTPGRMPRPPQTDAFGDLPLGDVALAYDTCLREANEQGKALQDHVSHLVIHGILHLLGYDHVDDDDAALMERVEAEILGKLGLSDPYS